MYWLQTYFFFVKLFLIFSEKPFLVLVIKAFFPLQICSSSISTRSFAVILGLVCAFPPKACSYIQSDRTNIILNNEGVTSVYITRCDRVL